MTPTFKKWALMFPLTAYIFFLLGGVVGGCVGMLFVGTITYLDTPVKSCTDYYAPSEAVVVGGREYILREQANENIRD